MNNYLQILNLFVGSDDLRPQMKTPNIVGEYAVATNAHQLVFFPKTLLPENTQFKVEGEYPNVIPIIQSINNCSEILCLETANGIIDKQPSLPEEEEHEEIVDCDTCNGTGNIDDDGEEDECFECDGTGKITKTHRRLTGKMVKDERSFVQIDFCYFSIRALKILIKVQKIIGGDVSLCYKESPNKPMIFKIGGVKVALMPFIFGEENKKYSLGSISFLKNGELNG
jgi:hypothetical protein